MAFVQKWRTASDFRKDILDYVKQCEYNRYEKLGIGKGAQELKDINSRDNNKTTLYAEIPSVSQFAVYCDTCRSTVLKYFKVYPEEGELFYALQKKAVNNNLTNKDTAQGAIQFMNRYMIDDDERQAESELRSVKVKIANEDLKMKRLKNKLIEKELNGTINDEDRALINKLLEGL